MRKSKLLLMALATLVVSLSGNVAFPQAQNVVILQGDITSDRTLTSDNVYVLRGAVFVREPAVLTIQAGTLIAGEFATSGTLIIDTGARIHAMGTAQAPIVFTSDQPPGPPFSAFDDRFRADWGGLIINGRAPINLPGGIGFGEGDTGDYGGNDPADDSGTLRYVRVEYAGTEFSPDNELNGIAFQGVGNQTDVDFIQVHMNLDDGVEFFGGTVNVRHVVLTNIGDDSMDYTDGWTGQAQFVIAQHRGDDADQGFEFDNNGENNNLLPRSSPTIYNCTIVGDTSGVFGGESDHGMLLREGTAGNLRNCIVLNMGEDGVRVDQSATVTQAQQGNLVLGNSIVFGSGGVDFDSDAAPFVNSQWPNIFQINPLLVDPLNLTNPDFRPQANSPAVNGTVPVAPPPTGNTFIQPTNFIGAMGPNPDQDWTRTPARWTTSDQGFVGIFGQASQGEGAGRVLPRNDNPR